MGTKAPTVAQRAAAAAAAGLPSDEQVRHAEDPSARVRLVTAGRARWQLALSTSSPEVLRRLAVDPAPEVRAAVAQSDHVGEALLRHLASDSRAEVRAAAAAAVAMPREVIEALARDRSVNVRLWVTANTQYDADLAELQTGDPDEHIRQHAQRHATGEPSP